MSWIAINIGTSNSSAALIIGDRITKVHPLGSSLDNCSFPTVAFVTKDHHIRVCAEANAWKCQDPSRFIKDFKYDIHQEQLAFLGVSYSEVISAIIKSIKVSAETMSGGRLIENVLLSIPNQYGNSDPRIDIMEKAAKAAGFECVEFIKESLATSYYYGVHNFDGVSLVYDLGETMFAPALVQKSADGLSVIVSSSGINVGGKYFDEILYKKLLTDNHIEYSDDDLTQIQQISSVIKLCREVKEQLSEFDSVSYPIPINNSGIFNIERKEFEGLISPLLEKTYMECDALLHRANIEWKDLNQIILVGGSSAIPCVKTLFKKYLYGKDLNVNFAHYSSIDGELMEPVYSVSLGACRYLQERDVVTISTEKENEDGLSNKEKGIKYYYGDNCPKNWLLAAFCFYKQLLEDEDNESYTYLLQIYQTIIDNLRIADGALVLEPILETFGQDAADLLVDYICQLQDRYEELGYDIFVQEIYKLQFWIEIIEKIHT
jgi:Ethanolamine utilization protein EutJ (predicted chaperonin)